MKTTSSLLMGPVRSYHRAIGVRLTYADGKIVDAEHLVAGNLSPPALANLTTVRAGILREVPYEYADSRGG
ncbi:MAG: hypothetical protein ABIT16_10510 [Croceibacterium sp.]